MGFAFQLLSCVVLEVLWEGCEVFYSVLWAMGGEEDCGPLSRREGRGDRSTKAKLLDPAEQTRAVRQPRSEPT